MQRIAALARLELTRDEVARFAEQLSAILSYAEQVQQVDTQQVAPLALPATPVWREDALVPSLPRETVLEQAPAADRTAGLFKVPRVIGS